MEEFRTDTIMGLLEKMAEEICDNCCKWPDKEKDCDKLYREHCSSCPLNLIG